MSQAVNSLGAENITDSGKNKKKLSLKHRESLTGLAFVSIWIVGFLIFMVYPIIYALFLSFNEVAVTPSGIATEWIGFANYNKALFIETKFLSTISDYVSEMLVSIPVIIICSLIISLLLNTKIKGTGFFRTLFFLPVIIISGPVMEQFTKQGVLSLTDAENLLDVEAMYDLLPEFVADAVSYLTNSFIMILWFTGVQILVFMIGLQKLDKSMYEAARIDGAGKWEIFWKLTLPGIIPMIIINIVYTIVMQSLFALNPIVKIIDAERVGSNAGGGYGYASALAWIYFFIITITLVFTLALFILFFCRSIINDVALAKREKRRLAELKASKGMQ